MRTGSWEERPTRAIWPLAACVSTFGAGFLLSGCAFWGDGPSISRSGEPYAGPELRVESDRPHHVVVMNAPSGGWTIRLDRVEQFLDRREAFLTITRPNPAYAHTQAFVEQHVATPVDRNLPLHVFARVLDFDEKPDAPYSLAVTTPSR